MRLELAINLGGSSSRAARTPPAYSGRNGCITAFNPTEGLRRCTRRYGSQREPFYPVTATASRTLCVDGCVGNLPSTEEADSRETAADPPAQRGAARRRSRAKLLRGHWYGIDFNFLAGLELRASVDEGILQQGRELRRQLLCILVQIIADSSGLGNDWQIQWPTEWAPGGLLSFRV